MTYDPELDQELARYDGIDGLEVKLMCYGRGEPKIQICRYSQRGAHKWYSKLGRLTVDEAEGLMREALPCLIAAASEGEGGAQTDGV
jgi:hypothetical protein